MCKFGPFFTSPFLFGDGKKKSYAKKLLWSSEKKMFALQVKYSMHARTHTRSRLFPFQCLFLRSRQSFAAANDCGGINGGKQSSAVSKQSWSLSPGPSTPNHRSTDLLYAVMERKDSHQTEFPWKIKRKAPGVNARSKTRWNQEKQTQGARNAFIISSCNVACPQRGTFYCISVCLPSSLQLNFTTLPARLMSGLPDCVKNKSKN